MMPLQLIDPFLVTRAPLTAQYQRSPSTAQYQPGTKAPGTALVAMQSIA